MIVRRGPPSKRANDVSRKAKNSSCCCGTDANRVWVVELGIKAVVKAKIVNQGGQLTVQKRRTRGVLEQRSTGVLDRGTVEDDAQKMNGAKVRTVRRDANVDTEPIYVRFGLREM